MVHLELPEIIQRLTQFIDTELYAELSRRAMNGKDHFVLDFSRILLFDNELAEQFLDSPEDSLKAFEVAIEKKQFVSSSDYAVKKIKVRIKSLPRSETMAIGSVRSGVLGKFRAIEGIVRQKSEVKFRVTMIRFECASCGTIIPVLQMRETIQKPKCPCGGRSFRKLSQELIDAYKVLLEEDPETGNIAQLSHIHVLCEADLTDHTVYNRFGPGSKVRVTGWVNLVNNEKTQIDHFFSANHVEILAESFEETVVSEADRDAIHEYVQQSDDPVTTLTNTLYHEIEGFDMEKKGIVLQMFGGCNKEVNLSRSRGDIHVLLIGGPGIAKSQLLKITQKAMPKARYAAGAGVSGVGLSAAVVKDELLGGYVLEPGIIPLASGGLLCLDELDKAKEEDLQSLHEALEQQSISIAKANIHAVLKAETTVLAAANPKHGVFDQESSVFSQIDLPPALINRFDIIFPMRADLFTEEQYGRVVKRMMSRWNSDDVEQQPSLTKEALLFVKKYISYARTINPTIPEELNKLILNYFMVVKTAATKANANVKFPVSGRQIDAIRRLSQAHARANLRRVVTEEDMKRACDVLMYSLKQVGINPETGTLDVTYLETGGKSSSKMMRAGRLHEFIRLHQMDVPGRKGVAYGDLYSEFKEQFETEMMFANELERLVKRGDVFCPSAGFYRTM